MLQILKENWYLAVVGAAVFAAALFLVYRQWKSGKEKKQQYEQRMKDQALTEALKNNFGRRNAFRKQEHVTPLEKADERKQQTDKKGLLVMKLTVLGHGRESYVVNPEEHVLLGRTEGMNDIILNDKNIAPQQSDIFLYKNHIYVRNLECSIPVAVGRKGGRTAVGEQGVRLLTGDIIYMGSSRIQVAIMDYLGNLVEG